MAAVNFLVIAQLTCAFVLARAGLAKLRSPAATLEAFTSLGMPTWLTRSRVPQLLGWGETALALALLLGVGWFLVLAGIVTLGLFVAYFLVVARALRFDEPVRSSCFRELGITELSLVTLLCNAGLAVLAVLILIAGGSHVSVWSLTGEGWGWVSVAALAAAVLVLMLQPPASVLPGAWLAEATLTDGYSGRSVRLSELAARSQGAVLLFLDSEGAACGKVLESRTEWVNRPVIPIVPGGEAVDAQFAWLPRLHEDLGGNVATALGVVPPAALRVDSGGRPVGEVARGLTEVWDTLVAAPSSAQMLPERRNGRPIPMGVLLTADRVPLTLHELAAERAQLLLGIEALNASAVAAIEQAELWQRCLPGVDLRVIAPFVLTETLAPEPVRRAGVYDHQRVLSEALGLTGQVSAVLVGTDALMAAGPVFGLDEVRALIKGLANGGVPSA